MALLVGCVVAPGGLSRAVFPSAVPVAAAIAGLNFVVVCGLASKGLLGSARCFGPSPAQPIVDKRKKQIGTRGMENLYFTKTTRSSWPLERQWRAKRSTEQYPECFSRHETRQ